MKFKEGKYCYSNERIAKMIHNLSDENHMITQDLQPSNKLLELVAKQKQLRRHEYIDLAIVENVLNEKPDAIEIAINKDTTIKTNENKRTRNNTSHLYSCIQYDGKLKILFNAYLMISYEHEHEERYLTVKTAQSYLMKSFNYLRQCDAQNTYPLRFMITIEESIRNDWVQRLNTEQGLKLEDVVSASLTSQRWPSQATLRAETQRVRATIGGENQRVFRPVVDNRIYSGDGAPVPKPKQAPRGAKDNTNGKERPASAKSSGQRGDMTPHWKQPGRERWMDKKDELCQNHVRWKRCHYGKNCNRSHTEEERQSWIAYYKKNRNNRNNNEYPRRS
jgi:hypothetical protein